MASVSSHSKDLEATPMFEWIGSSMLRWNIVAALLLAKSIRLTKLHVEEAPYGIQQHEINFLKFIDRVTTGSTFKLSNENTTLEFIPGMIIGGCFEHTVPAEYRSVTYIAEAALLLLAFARKSSEITFIGATQHPLDLSPDTLRTVTTRWLHLFGVESSVRVVRRGAPPQGGGRLVLSVKPIRRLQTVTATERGLIRRIRGIAYSSCVSPDLPRQVIASARGILNPFLKDVYIITDSGGNSTGSEQKPPHERGRTMVGSGYGLMLMAESTASTCVLSHDAAAGISKESAEELGKRAALQLLDQIVAGGCVDSQHQPFLLFCMAASPRSLTSVRFGHETPSMVSSMELIESMFGITCAIKQGEDTDDVVKQGFIVSCIGSQIINIAMRSS